MKPIKGGVLMSNGDGVPLPRTDSIEVVPPMHDGRPSMGLRNARFALRSWLLILFASLLPCATRAQAPVTTTVVEYYNAAQDHYFITASTQEISILDTGALTGWRRTGLTFNAYASNASGSSPVCRFYIPPSFGDSHFLSASAVECAQVQTLFPAFVFESGSVFSIALPEPTTGACPAGTVPVYRLWDHRVDTNHRYTTDRGVWQHMRDLGWVAEGYGADAVAMCSPSMASPGPVQLAVAGRAVIKSRAAGNVVALLEERLTSIFEPGPDRTLLLVQTGDGGARAYSAPTGWSLADFAVHPSGEVSIVLTTTTKVRLVRLYRDGLVRSDEPFVDPSASTDPYFQFDVTAKDDASLQPVLMHDAARLAPLGESLALVLRTGRNAVVAYRLNPDAAGSYRQGWRTLVEPGSSIAGTFLADGSFDTFGQLENPVGIRVDASDDTLAVGVVEVPFHTFAFEAHAAYFGEPITAQTGVIVSRVAVDTGHRMGSTVIDTQEISELHGLRSTTHGFALVGRVRTEIRPDGTGWDAFVASVAGDGALEAYRPVDVDRGDVLFDVVMLPSGRLLALGTTGYVQNPHGASISEETQPLLVLLTAGGSVVERLSWQDGPRQDQLRTIAPLNGHWLIGGMLNGPGTHSGDVQPALISADGFLLETVGLPE